MPAITEALRQEIKRNFDVCCQVPSRQPLPYRTMEGLPVILDEPTLGSLSVADSLLDALHRKSAPRITTTPSAPLPCSPFCYKRLSTAPYPKTFRLLRIIRYERST